MNLLHNFKTLFHFNFRKEIRSFWCATNQIHRTISIVSSNNLKEIRVNVFNKPIICRPIIGSVFNKKFAFTSAGSSHSKSIFDIETNVSKDVLLYENKSTLFSVLNYAVPIQFTVWSTLSYGYVSSVNKLPPEYLNVFNLIDLNNPMWKHGVVVAFMFAGNYPLLFTIKFTLYHTFDGNTLETTNLILYFACH